MTASSVSDPALTGYEPVDRFYVQRGRQGGRTVYTLDVSPLSIALGLLPRPDPTKKIEGQRDLRPNHAKEFAEYLLETDEWVSPALMLRAPNLFAFTSEREATNVQWGFLEVAKVDRGELRIMDGHHRVLGIYLAYDALLAKRQTQRELLGAAERNGEPASVAQFRDQLQQVETKLHQLANETVTINLHIVDNPAKFKQIFVDVNDNALGVKKSLQAGFDSRHVVHRALPDIVGHPLLDGRVDDQQDTISRKSEYFLGLKHVADLVRTLNFGMRSRVTKQREAALDEAELVAITTPFLDAITEGFPELGAMALSRITPIELRERSLLGSATIIRVLAGVWYELTTNYKWTPDTITEFFEHVAPNMVSPLPKDSPWLENGQESNFYKGATGYTSPNAHRGVDLALQRTLLQWAVEWAAADETEQPAA